MEKLRIVHLSFSVYGGAGRAAWRLHEAMLSEGLSSIFISKDASSPNLQKLNHLSVRDLNKRNIFSRALSRGLRVVANRQEWKEKAEIYRAGSTLMDKLDCEIATLPFGTADIINTKEVQEADVLIFHWVANMFDLPLVIKHLGNKPIIWTLHDMNPFQGIFHYADDENANSPIASALDERIKKMKERYLQGGNIKVVAPSKWLTNAAAKSRVFNGKDCTCIPYSIDFQKFTDTQTEGLREKYGFRKEDIILLFVADHITIRRKGFDMLKEAVSHNVNPAVKFIAIGGTTPDNLPGVNITYVPKITDDRLLVEYYKMADAFVIPSREDNLPNVMIEAQACGCPVIGFNVGGIGEHVQQGRTGILATEISGQGLAEAIEQFVSSRETFSKSEIRNYANENFSRFQQVASYLDVYRSFQKTEQPISYNYGSYFPRRWGFGIG